MRIIAGRWAGRELVSPGGRVRPTAEPLRDAWLTLLEADLAGARILELYAGTGALGLEALSRGARSVDFVESGSAALHALKANVAALRVRRRTRVFVRDALRFAAALEASSYDIALADPPYGSRQGDRLVEHWLSVPFSRVLCVEHATEQVLPGRRTVHRFGESSLSFYFVRRPR